MGEPEEAKVRRARRVYLCLPVRRLRTEVHQLGLFRVQLQTEFPQPFSEYRPNAVRVVLVGKQHDKVVAVPNQRGRTAQTRLHLLGNPDIQDVVQVDITEDRRNSSANNIANSRVKCGLRISRECLAPWSRGCPDVDAVLVLETIAPADREARQ
jgi:hypothetical protein